MRRRFSAVHKDIGGTHGDGYREDVTYLSPTVLVAVVEWALGGIDGQHLVVGANAVALSVSV